MQRHELCRPKWVKGKDVLTKKCDLAYSVFNRLNPQGTI